MGSLAASIASSSGFAEGWPGGVSRGSKRRAKGVYVPEAFSNVSARGIEDDCVYIDKLIEWWKKNDYINRWKDYYPIPDASSVTTMTIIFEYSFNPLIVG